MSYQTQPNADLSSNELVVIWTLVGASDRGVLDIFTTPVMPKTDQIHGPITERI